MKLAPHGQTSLAANTEHFSVLVDTVSESEAFLTGFCTNALLCTAALLAFSILRSYFPSVYSNNVLSGSAPQKSKEGLFGWVADSLAYTFEEAAAASGLDGALKVEFCSLAARLLALTGLPVILLFCPIHYLSGNRSSMDFIRSSSMGNVRLAHPWIYHLHAIASIWVVVVTKMVVFQAQEGFLQRRFSWMKGFPIPRANTVLMQNIPAAFRSEEKLRGFFAELFGPSAVASIHLVKLSQELAKFVEDRDAAQAKKYEAELQFNKDNCRPTLRKDWMSDKIDSIEYFTGEIQRLDSLISTERARIEEADGDVNSSSAFVTFSTRRDAALAGSVRYGQNESEWAVREAPDPEDIRWADLQQDAQKSMMRTAMGYASIALVFVCFTPASLAISVAAQQVSVGVLQPFWDSLAPTLGLTLLLAFLPTILLSIFKTFFTLRSEAMAQHLLQFWYFWFQVIFVIVLPVLGTNFGSFAKKIYYTPDDVLELVADKVPQSTAFFNNFLLIQCTGACIAATRHINLAKFLLFRAIYPHEEARAKSEPEDQDFYGMGGRSARWTINLAVGLAFCQLSPTITLLAIACFLLYRVLHGYLTICAETKKPDLGGLFWVESLRQILQVLVLYVCLMCGIVFRRAPTFMPPGLLLLGLAYTVVALVQFEREFQWQVLPFPEVLMEASREAIKAEEGATKPLYYEQPELHERATKQ